MKEQRVIKLDIARALTQSPGFLVEILRKIGFGLRFL
jgi:hypothetical protein